MAIGAISSSTGYDRKISRTAYDSAAKTEEVKKEKEESDEPSSTGAPEASDGRFDRFIRSGEMADGEKKADGKEKVNGEKKAGGEEKEETTMDTSAINAQIKRLEEKKKNLEQEIQKSQKEADGNQQDSRADAAKNELQSIEQEIQKLKSPEYQKAHAVVTTRKVSE